MDPSEEFSSFYESTWSRTVACAYAISGELGAAEEAAQEAYTRAWPRWSKLQRYDDPGAWVRQVATRQAISRWRRVRTATRHLARTGPPEPTPPPTDSTLLLVGALQHLPIAQRRALALHHLAGYSVDEVARIEGCPPGTIKARLSRGRARLAELLNDDETESHHV